MKKIILFFMLISLPVAGMATGAEVAGTISNKVAVPKKVAVPNKVPVMDKAVVSGMVTVPNVIGLLRDQAVSVLLQNGLGVDDSDYKNEDYDVPSAGCVIGEVIYQEPGGGEKVSPRSDVILKCCTKIVRDER
jgi:hypothetical protein